MNQNLYAPKDNLSFPKLLDFSFPSQEIESPLRQIGEVTYVGDGVCHVTGLEDAKIDEVIIINAKKGLQKALILGVSQTHIEAVVLGDYSAIKRGDLAQNSHSKLKIGVGVDLLGRVINPLGEPLDGLGPINSQSYREVEFQAPGVVDRLPITKPLHTGIIAIDTTIPIGRGQRELVIGDRKTGKSRTMIDIISNQATQNVYCIYVGIGIQAAKAKASLSLLKERGALKYTTLVFAHSDDPPPLQYIAPYVGAAIGEAYMYQGKHALVIYDDLSKQAKAYRQVSLLLKRSPGRDAYPGDIFFLHSRLLERAAQLNTLQKGGSLTALPVAETQMGDVSDYIITNLMSITDGHIYLDANMMHEGILPAINSGASVSRIGGKVQVPLLQKVGELASRIHARYQEVKSFETINTEISPETIAEINRGKRLRLVFSQESSDSLSLDEQVILLAIMTSPLAEPYSLDTISTMKRDLITFYRQVRDDTIISSIKAATNLDQIDAWLKSFFADFLNTYPYTQTPTTE